MKKNLNVLLMVGLLMPMVGVAMDANRKGAAENQQQAQPIDRNELAGRAEFKVHTPRSTKEAILRGSGQGLALGIVCGVGMGWFAYLCTNNDPYARTPNNFRPAKIFGAATALLGAVVGAFNGWYYSEKYKTACAKAKGLNVRGSVVTEDTDGIKAWTDYDPNLKYKKDAQDNNLLHYAVKYDAPKSTDYLVRNIFGGHKEVDQRNRLGLTPYAMALQGTQVNKAVIANILKANGGACDHCAVAPCRPCRWETRPSCQQQPVQHTSTTEAFVFGFNSVMQ